MLNSLIRRVCRMHSQKLMKKLMVDKSEFKSLMKEPRDKEAAEAAEAAEAMAVAEEVMVAVAMAAAEVMAVVVEAAVVDTAVAEAVAEAEGTIIGIENDTFSCEIVIFLVHYKKFILKYNIVGSFQFF